MTAFFVQDILYFADRLVVSKCLDSYDPLKEGRTKMYAIVETGGKQYKPEEGKYTDIELLDAEAD